MTSAPTVLPNTDTSSKPVAVVVNDKAISANLAYKEYKDNPTDENLLALMSILKAHAARVCWLILRTVDHHLIQEMVDDAVLQLPKFEGKAAFSTWAHAIFRFAVIDELRFRKKNLGYQLDYVAQKAARADGESGTDALDKSALMASDSFQRVEAQATCDRLLEELNPQEQYVMRLQLLGWRIRDIAKEMNLSQQRISKIIIQAKNKMWEEYRTG